MPAAFGAGGKPLETSGATFTVTCRYGDATPIDMPFWTATRVCRVVKIMYRILGTAGSATGMVRKAASGVAPASGTALQAAEAALDATTNTNLTPALTATAADLNLAAGDSLCLDVTGTLTGATGVITCEMAWL